MSKPNLYTRLAGMFSSTQKAKTSFKPSTLPKPTNSPVSAPSKTVNQKVDDLLDEKDSRILVEKFKHLSQYSYFRERCREVYKLTIHRLAVAKQYELIEEALESQKKYVSSEGFASRIIHLYGKSGMFDHAYKLFDELPNKKRTQGVKCFNVLLGAAANSEKYDKVVELFRELPVKLSIKPNVDCYNTTMHALCKMGLVDEAVLLLDEMKENSLDISVVSYNTLLCAYYEAGECEKGNKLWERMVKDGVAPDIHSYNFKIRGLINDGKLPEALELAMQLKDKGVKPNVGSYNVVIQGLIKDDDLVSVKEWYGKLLESRLLPNKTTFGILVPFLCQRGDYGFAFEVCEIMLKRRFSLIDEAILQNVVDGLAMNSTIDKAKVLVELGLSNSYAAYHLVMPASV
ncbi:uncharacterized protein LOC141639974 [Silene latifolia]|uniref:uncharacterized protein LOC141639974 n=1 Tax=Silene latifolia TaxID=37657 RepID=UPI003D770D8E